MACAMQFLKKWIKKLKAHNVHAPVGLQANDQSGMSIDKISCKSASQMYVKMEFETATADKRMKNADLSEETIHHIYSIPFKVTKDTRLVIIIHHILPTNATLFRDLIILSEQCHLCTEKQTLIHLFVTCSHVMSFWTHFTDWWNEKNQEVLTLSETNIIYGFTNNLPLCLCLNLCIGLE